MNHKTLPLEFALEGGSLAKVRYFIEDAKVSLDCSNSFCNYYLRATDNTEDVQEYMLKLAQRMPTVFNDGMTDILVAAIANNVDAIAAKVAATPLEWRSELLAVVDSRGLGIVYYAAAAGAADVIQYLFEHGLASQEQQSEELRYGLTALCNGIKLNKSRRNADHQRLDDKARRAIIMASYLPVDGGKASRF